MSQPPQELQKAKAVIYILGARGSTKAISPDPEPTHKWATVAPDTGPKEKERAVLARSTVLVPSGIRSRPTQRRIQSLYRHETRCTRNPRSGWLHSSHGKNRMALGNGESRSEIGRGRYRLSPLILRNTYSTSARAVLTLRLRSAP